MASFPPRAPVMDANAMRLASPQSPTHGSTPPSAGKHSRQQGPATVYQTTGPEAYTDAILSPGSRTPLLNPRSCVTCRRRKVRCDKQMPCSNCRRALIPCIYPAPGRAPRQPRQKDPSAPAKNSTQREAELVKRLRKLEGIVEELSGQIDVDEKFEDSAPPAEPVILDNEVNSTNGAPASQTGSQDVNVRMGRMLLNEREHGARRYISSGFWSKMNDELNAIRSESQKLTDEEDDESDWEGSQTGTPATAASTTDHHGFILGYRSHDVDLAKCHPLPSHATFLWSVYMENVEPLAKILHVPTVEKIFREARKGNAKLSPPDEALIFAIYFAAVTSLEPEDIETNFGVHKDELLAQYRFAVEQALAKANYLNTADLAVMQAFSLFLLVVRRHDESRFCWSMTALAVRLAQGMGLHRDGEQFGLPPYETEMRRRVWWVIMSVDLRSTEEHGTSLAIADGTYDTRIPMNINDADISPDSTVMPPEREGRTDMAAAVVRYSICSLTRQFQTPAAIEGEKCDLAMLAAKEKKLLDLYQSVQQKFLRDVAMDEADRLYYVVAMIARVIMAKASLVLYGQMLFPGAEQQLTAETRQRLFVGAISMIECSVKLGTDRSCRQYRWLLKSYTSLHTMSYTVVEICRRPWTALVERGWKAITEFEHHPLQIPAKGENVAVTIPLRKLLIRAQKHREAEIKRLKANPEEARRLDFAERMNPAQTRFGPVPGAEHKMDEARDEWRRLVQPDGAGDFQPFPSPTAVLADGVPERSSAAFGKQPAQSPAPQAMPMTDAMDFVGAIMEGPSVGMVDFWRFSDVEGIQGSSTMAQPQSGVLAVNDDPEVSKGMTVATYLWPDSMYGNMNSKFDDDMMDDSAMGEGFNWQDWGQSIRGLELQNNPLTGMPTGMPPMPPNQNPDEQWQ